MYACGFLLLVIAALTLRAETAGYVIYKTNSSDPDNVVQIIPVSFFTARSGVSKGQALDGSRLDFMPGQKPIYLPAPGYSSDSPSFVVSQIDKVAAQFPRITEQLSALRASWQELVTSNNDAGGGDSPETTVKRFTTESGETYHDVSISSADDHSITITHANGIATIQVADFPMDLVNFPPAFQHALQSIQAGYQSRLQAEKAKQEAASKPAEKPWNNETVPLAGAVASESPLPQPGASPVTEISGSTDNTNENRVAPIASPAAAATAQ